MGKFKGIVKLSKTNLQKIKNNESVIIDGQTYTKQEDTLYVPDLCVDIPTSLNELSNNETDRYAKLSDIPEVVDGLTSSSTTKPLSANQGKVLNDNKLDKKPDGTNNLITNSNKISDVYLPDAILGQVVYGGNINQSGVATLSNNFKTKYNISDNTLDMTSVSAATYEGVYFIAQDTTTFTNATIIGVANVSTGDWVISYGSSWGKIDNTDSVTGVKGNEETSYRTGNINITPQNVGAEPAFTKNTAFNKDFETSTTNIKMNGSVSVGSSTNIARADHVHPSDTTKVDKTTTIAGIELDGNISASSLYSALGLGDVATHDVADNGVSDNDTSIPTTAQVKSYVDTNGGKIDTISVNGTNQTITSKNVDLSVYEVDHTNKSSVSLNTLVTPGNYGIADDCTNMPVAENGTLFVGEWDDGQYVQQIFFAANDKCYVRHSTAMDNSTWSTWKNVAPEKVSELTNDSGYITSYIDTGATSVETTGDGNVVSSASYDSSTRKLTLTKGITALTSHQDISGKEDISNKVTSLSSSSTDTQYPSAKAVYDVTKAINDLIPSQATSSNQLADKAFVNSSISTATATYRGNYNLVSDLSLTTSDTHSDIATALASEISTADNNDYCFVQIPTADATPTQIASIERYKFDGTNWAYEYELNNSRFTSAQWAAINSGITSALVAKISANETAISGLATVATSGNYNDLNNKPVWESPIIELTGTGYNIGSLNDGLYRFSQNATLHWQGSNDGIQAVLANSLMVVSTNSDESRNIILFSGDNIFVAKSTESYDSGGMYMDHYVRRSTETVGRYPYLTINLSSPSTLGEKAKNRACITGGKNLQWGSFSANSISTEDGDIAIIGDYDDTNDKLPYVLFKTDGLYYGETHRYTNTTPNTHDYVPYSSLYSSIQNNFTTSQVILKEVD